MLRAKGYAALSAQSPLAPFNFDRREPGASEIDVQILYCGVCHTDLHQVRNDWKGSLYPMVPGHEIVGRVIAAGNAANKFEVGAIVAIGVIVDSCRQCASCRSGHEQYCEQGPPVETYNSIDRVDGTVTKGGYADNYVVDERFVYAVPPNLNPAAVAPLLCAGITTYSPLRHWKVGPGTKVGIVGLGGLGHMGLKFAHSFGAHVVQFTTSLNKRGDAIKLGADEVVLSTNPNAMKAHANSFDFILDTVSAPHSLDPYTSLLKRDGVMVVVGLPETFPVLDVTNLINKRASVAGSMIGGVPETQEMLEYCARHNLAADVEVIPIVQINQAYERLLRQDVRYRFVIDMNSLG